MLLQAAITVLLTKLSHFTAAHKIDISLKSKLLNISYYIKFKKETVQLPNTLTCDFYCL